ncbi:hypothetical protein D3C84_1054650 [compost metagenome]
MPCQCGEFVRCGDKRQARERSQLGGNRFAKTVRRIQPGADGGATLGQFTHIGQGAADRPFGVIQLRDER